MGLDQQARLWPTPAAQDDNKTPEAHLAMKQRMKGGPRRTVTSLQVEAQLWRTPQAQSPNSLRGSGGTAEQRQERGHALNLTDQASQWPTPKATTSGPDFARQEHRVESHGSGADDLVTMVTRWQTPTARDHRTGADMPGRHGSPSLPVQIDRLSHPDPATPSPGEPSSPDTPTSRPRLNARFAEWLMGLPEGWASPEPMNSAPSVTAWCRSQRRLLSTISGTE